MKGILLVNLGSPEAPTTKATAVRQPSPATSVLREILQCESEPDEFLLAKS